MKKKRKLKYLVSYFYTTEEGNQGWGTTNFTVTGTRPLLDHVKTREQILEVNTKFTSAVIIAISEIRR